VAPTARGADESDQAPDHVADIVEMTNAEGVEPPEDKRDCDRMTVLENPTATTTVRTTTKGIGQPFGGDLSRLR
jgi:hypothetical protein